MSRALLYRFTGLDGTPNHFTDSFRSAAAQLPAGLAPAHLARLQVGERMTTEHGTWERIA